LLRLVTYTFTVTGHAAALQFTARYGSERYVIPLEPCWWITYPGSLLLLYLLVGCLLHGFCGCDLFYNVYRCVPPSPRVHCQFTPVRYVLTFLRSAVTFTPYGSAVTVCYRAFWLHVVRYVTFGSFGWLCRARVYICLPGLYALLYIRVPHPATHTLCRYRLLLPHAFSVGSARSPGLRVWLPFTRCNPTGLHTARFVFFFFSPVARCGSAALLRYACCVRVVRTLVLRTLLFYHFVFCPDTCGSFGCGCVPIRTRLRVLYYIRPAVLLIA